MKCIIPTRLADDVVPQLHALAPDTQVVLLDPQGQPAGPVHDAEVLLRWWTPQDALRRLLAEAPLRWVHTPSAGVDGILIPELIERGITLTNSAGAHSIPIAEFVLLFMLGHVKQVHKLLALTPENAWDATSRLPLNELNGQTVLILGLGHIGQEIATRAAAFGMRVLGSRRRPASMAGVEQVVGEDAWRELLPEADYVVVATPLTAATHSMVDAAAFAQMKPGAYLINIARGQIVDTAALLDALTSGRLAGAGLDALPEEPLPPDHPLWQAPNVWITPHISWSSPHMRGRAMAIFFENMRRYRAGEPLINVVDTTAGY